MSAGAPGTTPMDASPSSSMAPPPLPQLNTSAAPGTSSMNSPPPSAGGSVRRAAPEPNKRALYIGGLDPRVTEDILKQIFETTGHVQSVKIIPDKNFQSKGFNYGFVEYDDPGAAERALSTLNGRKIHQNEIRVNWAYQSNTVTKEDTSGHFHVFVGDLSNEVSDEVLLQAFSTFGTCSEARVMWDMKTGRSRGYGFVAFREKDDAEKAISAMDREWLGSRAIRCNWANQKGQPSFAQQQAMAAMGVQPMAFMHHQYPTQGPGAFEMVLNQTPSWQVTCYVGNLTPYTTPNDVVPLFQNYGYVVESRFQSDRGFAFIKMDSHEKAAQAIVELNGYHVHGRPLKCSWGKDRPPTGQFDPASFSPQSAQTPTGFPPTPTQFYPQYGAPTGPMSPTGGSPGQFPATGYAPYGQMPPQGAGGFRPSHGHTASFSGAPYGYGPSY